MCDRFNSWGVVVKLEFAVALRPGALVRYSITGEAGVVASVELNENGKLVAVNVLHSQPVPRGRALMPTAYYPGTRPGRKVRNLDVV